MSRRWTTREVDYLAAHATEGAEAIAAHLGRSARAVERCAQRYGISLQVRYFCPRCSRYVLTPLNPRTGWCRVCSIEESHARAARKNCEVRRELEEEERRALEAERARQAIYTDTDRIKKRLKRIKAKK